MKRLLVTLLAALMVFGAGLAIAGIDGTHHDMSTGGMTVGGGLEKCAYCHAKTGISAVADVGDVGGFCIQVCHLSTATIIGAYPETEPKSPGVFNYAAGVFSIDSTDNAGTPLLAAPTALTGGHGLNKATLTTIDAGEGTAVGNTAWPHTLTNALQCTSCHAVHDASNPPFLNAKLSDGSQTGGFCQRCHNSTTRIEVFADVAGDHPVEFTWSPVAASARAGSSKTDGTQMGNRLIAAFVPAVGSTNIGIDTTPVAQADLMAATGVNWNLGGHFIDPATGMPAAAGNFGCYSCHTVHAGVTELNEAGSVKLLLVGASMDNVCYGCHTENPGMTAYGHPIGEETPVGSDGTGNNWTIPMSGAYTAPSAYAQGAGFAPLCVTCHDVHGGTAAYMAIRTIAAIPAGGSACEMCHAASFGAPTAADSHHPGQADPKDYNADLGFNVSTGWLTPDGLGDLDDGLTCPDCHIGDGSITKRATAHNWL